MCRNVLLHFDSKAMAVTEKIEYIWPDTNSRSYVSYQIIVQFINYILSYKHSGVFMCMRCVCLSAIHTYALEQECVLVCKGQRTTFECWFLPLWI